MSRDYRVDLQAFIEARMPDSDYVQAVVAQKITAELREKDPDLLAGWLDLNAEQVLNQYIGTQERSQRARVRAGADASVFGEAADRHAAGDQTAMHPFQLRLVVTDDLLRRRVGDMTKADHLFVAEKYEETSNSALMESAFHRAISKKIPNGKTTSDVLSEEQYLRIRKSIRK